MKGDVSDKQLKFMTVPRLKAMLKKSRTRPAWTPNLHYKIKAELKRRQS